MANVGPLTAQIGLPVWGTPANFNRFRVLASLLQRRRSTEANQTLHNLWPSPELVHYIYILGAFAPWRYFVTCKLHRVQVLRSPILAALLHGTPAAGLSQTLRRAWYKEWNYGTFADDATYIRPDGHHVGHRPTF